MKKLKGFVIVLITLSVFGYLLYHNQYSNKKAKDGYSNSSKYEFSDQSSEKDAPSTASRDDAQDSVVTKQEVAQIVKEEVENHPEMVVDALTKYENQKIAEERQKINDLIKVNSAKIYDQASSPFYVQGTPVVKIATFFDYNCLYCKKMSEVVKQLIDDKQPVLIVFKELPILDKDSLYASKAALSVYKISQEKYLPFHFALMEDNSKDALDVKVDRIAKSLKINPQLIKQKMDSDEITQLISGNVKLIQDAKMRFATPTFIIDDQIAPPFDYDAIVALIKKKSEMAASSDQAQNPVNQKADDPTAVDSSVVPANSSGNEDAAEENATSNQKVVDESNASDDPSPSALPTPPSLPSASAAQ